ncbi:ribonuclease [Fodinicola feengrottensis]|uniref:ribonuclease n=1 Tax=Fodinicola feengrottensis TaxID=435914 RepID=UPI0036F1A0F5
MLLTALLAGLFGLTAPASVTAGPAAASAQQASVQQASVQQASVQKALPLPTVGLSSLPSQATDTVRLVQKGGPFPYPQDGVVFDNREGLLPAQTSGYYHEYTVKTPGAPTRGTRRIITGGGSTNPAHWYYTGDHYKSFSQVDITR